MKNRHEVIFENRSRMIALSLFLIILGAKLHVLSLYSVALPYLDGWDVFGIHLLKPYHEGTLKLSELFALHNEHRIFFTRISALALLAINRIWDPQLIMVVNAILSAFTAVLFYKMAAAPSGKWRSIAVAAAVGVLFGFPFSWMSVLVAFQSQFYFMIFFSVLSIWFFVRHPALTPKWFLGMALAGCAYFSLGSGLLILPAVAAAIVLRSVAAAKLEKREIVALALLLGLFLVGYLNRLVDPRQDFLVSKSVWAFLLSFGKDLAWPFSERPILALPMYFPFVYLVCFYFFKRRPIPRENMYFIAVGIFVMVQALAVAYVRGGTGNSPANRYVEILIFGPLVNLMAVMVITKNDLLKSFPRKISIWLVAFWLSIGVIGLVSEGALVFSGGLKGRLYQSLESRNNISNYLKSGDRAYLENKPFFLVSYLNSEGLIKNISDETLRDLLPVSAEGGDRRLKSGNLRFITEGWMSAGVWLLSAGVILMLATAIVVCRPRGGVPEEEKINPL